MGLLWLYWHQACGCLLFFLEDYAFGGFLLPFVDVSQPEAEEDGRQDH